MSGSAAAVRTGHRVLADSPHARRLEGIADVLEDVVRRRLPETIAQRALRSGAIRGSLLFWYGRSYDAVVTTCDSKGSWPFLVLETWFARRRRRVFLLEFIRKEPSLGWRRLLYPLVLSAVVKPAIRRAVKTAQVLTTREVGHYAATLGVEPERFRFIPWALIRTPEDRLPAFEDSPDRRMVLSAGRVKCDWDTLFRAAEGRPWPLTIVCWTRDLKAISRLNHGGRAHVFCNVPYWQQYVPLLRSASLFVMSMQDCMGSSGQVRFGDAISAGVPIVATRIKGLEGYALHGETCVLVEPGDWKGLREAIETSLAHPDQRRLLRERAFARAARWTRDQYYATLSELVVSHTS
jgi:glycosyltransferase involved in cell wall biosynthesis